MKKQILSIVLAVSMLASMFTAFMLPAVAADATDRNVMVSSSDLTVDGERDDEYLMSSPVKSTYKIKDTGNKTLSFEAYGVATEKGFYLWIDIKGETTYVNDAAKHPNEYGSPNRDYLQVYYNMSANQQSQDHIGYIMHDYNNRAYFRNAAGSNKAGYTATAPEGFKSAAKKTATGWVSEMFIPFASGSPTADGMAAGNLDTFFSIGYQYNDDYDGSGGYDCAVYDLETTSYWSDYRLMAPVKFFSGMVFGKLSKTNVFMDGDIAVDYQVALGAEYNPNDIAVRYTITPAGATQPNEPVLVKGVLVDPALDIYNFSYGLAPYRMNDKIKVELLNGDEVIDDREEFTVRQHAIDMYNNTKEKLKISENQYIAMRRLVIDMLNYGAMCQEFVKYDTANLVNSGYESDFDDISVDYTPMDISESLNSYTAELESVSVYFDSSDRLCFKFTANDINNIAITIDNGRTFGAVDMAYTYDAEEGVYVAYSDIIDGADYHKNMTVKLVQINNKGTDWESRTVLQTAEVSVNACLAKYVNSSNATLAKLGLAAYNYGLSSRALAGA